MPVRASPRLRYNFNLLYFWRCGAADRLHAQRYCSAGSQKSPTMMPLQYHCFLGFLFWMYDFGHPAFLEGKTFYS